MHESFASLISISYLEKIPDSHTQKGREHPIDTAEFDQPLRLTGTDPKSSHELEDGRK
ncbi:hypothetical protein L3i20_v216080 [Paenibacillus sp. L3-i20]|nr:hypothetical protein L3i20_v216080 [Paenibacillus sp. L3-i20]